MRIFHVWVRVDGTVFFTSLWRKGIRKVQPNADPCSIFPCVTTSWYRGGSSSSDVSIEWVKSSGRRWPANYAMYRQQLRYRSRVGTYCHNEIIWVKLRKYPHVNWHLLSVVFPIRLGADTSMLLLEWVSGCARPIGDNTWRRKKKTTQTG